MLRNGKKFRHGLFEEGDPEPCSSSELIPDHRNPMLNPVVLKRLFEFCKVRELLKYRLVCREWYSVSLTRIRNKVSVRISEGTSSGELQWSRLHEDLALEDKPFRCFSLDRVDFVSSPPPRRPPASSYHNKTFRQRKMDSDSVEQLYKNMEQFWTNHGQFIRKLFLQGFVYSVEAFKTAIFEATPNLEKLRLYQVALKRGKKVPKATGCVALPEVLNVQSNLKSLDVDSSEGHFPIRWRLLFDQFPNIERLEMNALDQTVDPITPLMEALESFNEIALKTLILHNVHREEANSIKRLFHLPKLNLTTLLFTAITCEEEELSIIQAAMQGQGDTLETLDVNSFLLHLELENPDLEQNQIFPFRPDTLPILTKLVMSGQVCHNFNFLQQTPNLQVLCLHSPSRRAFRRTDVNGMRALELPSLKTFYISSFLVSKKEIEFFVKAMPNLEKFHAFLDHTSLRIICQKWRKLRELSIGTERFVGENEEGIDDKALTGMSPRRKHRLPNITDLTCLEELKIENTGRIGDASVWNAFLKMPKLRTITVSLTLETSDEAYNALRERFPEGNISRCPPRASNLDYLWQLHEAAQAIGLI